jgi:diguanylate cyclase (GGDEF)-like protein/PAS domain S-box-containing protein
VGVARNLPRLALLAEDSRIRLAAATVPWSRPGDDVVLTRVIAYLQLAGAGLAAVVLAMSSVVEVDRRGMIVCALVAAVFAAGLLGARARIRSRWLTAIALISTTLFGGFMFFGGDMATVFSPLFLGAAAAAVWFCSGARTGVQVGWMAGIYALALWFARSPGEPAWPQMSGRVGGEVLVGSIALCAVALLTKMFKRRMVEGDQRLAAIVKSSQDPIISADRDGAIRVWNPGAERLYGYTQAEAIGQPVSLLIPPGRRGEEPTILGRALAGATVENYETERVCKDGSVVTVSLSVSPIYDPGGRVIGASSIQRDMTSAVRARGQLALQAELLDEVDAAVVFLDVPGVDMEGVVRYWSGGAQRLYGYTAEEAIGHELVDLILPEESRAELLRLGCNALAGQPVEGELDVHDKQGRTFPVYVRARPVSPTAEVGPGGVISISVDISARREAEAAARRHAEGQQEIASLGRLALRGGSLEELFDQAAEMASRVLSGDCAELIECLPDAQGFIVRAAVGWPDGRRGAHVAGEARLGPGYAVRSREPLLVEDWEQERRFVGSRELLARGVRSTVAVLVGDADSPFGVLTVHYTRAGAVPPDCLPFLDALANVLADAIHSRDVQEQIRHQALHDGLTGLPNRTLFLDRVEHALARGERHPQPLAVFFVDLDQFKLVNDSLGHEAGDELLRLIAPRLAGAIRPSDTLARLGGDEFAVLCEQLPSNTTATRIAGQLTSALEKPIVLDGHVHTVSASIGIALGTPESSAADLLRDADAAMYQAKAAGRGRFELFDNEMHARVLDRVRTESALRTALAKKEIYVHYQPLVSLRSGEVVGAEALARWRHPDWGPVSPAEFIPVAEDSGLIHQLGAQVMHRAARECAAWGEDPGFAGIAVNVSIRQLVQPDEVASLVREVIAADGIPPGFLTLEITESVLIKQIDEARNALESLNDLGVRLSLDDFGTGYSSLSYLADLPFDCVKIDRLLIRNIVASPQADALAAAIIHMGHALDKQVIAEGVETLEQAARLQELDCDIAQGFYFGKPMAPAMLTALLQDRPSWLLPSLARGAVATQPRRRVGGEIAITPLSRARG